jgi:hypothetical protein
VPARKLAEAQRIEADFDGWHVWVSSVGRYWAVRQGPDARCSRDDPRPMTVDADDADGLAALLAQYPSPEGTRS